MWVLNFVAVMRCIPSFGDGARCGIGADSGEKFWHEKLQVCEHHQSCC